MDLRHLRFESLEHRIMLASQSVTGPTVIGPIVADASVAVPGDVVLGGDGTEIPEATSGPTGLSPTQLLQAYGINQITFAGGSIVGNGAGMTIAIVDAFDDPSMLDSTDANFSTSDLAKFDAYYGLPNPPSFTKLNETGGTSLPGPDPAKNWEGEESLDVEWAHVIAPAANIILFEATSATTPDLDQAIQTAGTTPGVNVVSMSFGGAESSSELTRDTSDFVTPATTGGVTFVAGAGDATDAHYPGISPYVVGVGGTTLSVDSAGDYEGETTWNLSGGGVSQFEPQPAYQSKVVSAYSTTMETLPDVAFDANPNSGVSVYNSYTNGTSTPWSKTGGNSVGAPSWAALIAIIDQGRSINGLGSLSGYSQTLPMLYSLPASDFHDIVSGTNFAGDSAGPGYDLATGLGSPIANLLVADMVSMGEPDLAINGGSATFVQGGNPVFLAPNLTLTDTAGTLVQSATITIDNVLDDFAEAPIVNPTGTNITLGFDGKTLTLTGPDTVADYEQVLRTLEYIDTAMPANTTTRQVTIAVTDANGDTAQVTQSVNIDVAPLVVGAFVGGSAWSSSYLGMLDTAGLGSSAAAEQGFELASGADQLTTILPWTNINQISIAFSEPVNVSQSSLTLYNSTNTAIASSGFSYNSAANIATWQFATSLVANKYVMNLAADSVSDTAGAELDGDWSTGVSTFAAGSGDGSPGSDFNFYFDVLPGDANNSGTVTNGDVLITKLQVGAVSNASNYLLDVNGSGNITNGDVLLEKLQVGSNLNTFATPQLPPQSAPAMSPAGASPSNDLAPATLTTTVAAPASVSISQIQLAPVPITPPPAADSLSSVVILPAAMIVALPSSATLPGDASSMELPTIAPPAADVLFRSLDESARAAATALEPSNALALVLNSLSQPSSSVAAMPAVGVAAADVPTALATLITAEPSSRPSPLGLAEIFFANPDAAAKEFLAFDYAFADPAERLARENPHPAFGHLLPGGEGF